MLHVVIITPGFPVDENDTICVPFLQLYAQELLKNPVKLTIITLEYPALVNYKWHGVDVITLTKKKSNIISKLFLKHRLKKSLKKINHKNKIDVIHHMWFNKFVYVSDKFAIKRSIKHITTFCGQDVLLQNKSLNKLNSYKGNLVCISLFQKLKLNTSYNFSLINWGIEDIKKTNSSRSIDLICCGSVNSVKNHSQFIDIVYELSQKITLNKVVICGDGDKTPELIRKIEALNLQKIVELKGSLQRREVIKLMQQSKVLVHTATYEGFGLVLAEGLACGCVVISSPVGIAYNDKSIITCNTTLEFVDEIEKKLQASENILECINHYPISETTKNYLALYSN